MLKNNENENQKLFDVIFIYQKFSLQERHVNKPVCFH